MVNLSKKAESVTDRESYIDFRLRLLGEQVWSLTQLLFSKPFSGNLDLGALPGVAFFAQGHCPVALVGFRALLIVGSVK